MLGIPVHQLPTVNACLNGVAALLLMIGYLLIKRRRELAHQRVMLSAFGVSVLFLASYVAYHLQTATFTRFAGSPPVSYLYKTILITHIILAATVPFLAGVTIYLGLRDRRQAHRRLARWTFPIWLYVSVTGVIIYLMLYHLYPAAP